MELVYKNFECKENRNYINFETNLMYIEKHGKIVNDKNPPCCYLEIFRFLFSFIYFSNYLYSYKCWLIDNS